MTIIPLQQSNIAHSIQDISPVQNKTWKDYVPVVGYIALGVLFSKTFAIGLAAGSILYASTFALHAGARHFNLFPNLHLVDPEIQKKAGQSATSNTIFTPILQQVMHNGILLKVFQVFTRYALPPISLPLSAITASLCSALVFSKVQGFSRPQENARYYNFINLISGVAYSALALNFGIAAAIGAHVVNNLIHTYDARRS